VLEEVSGGVGSLADAVRPVRVCHHAEGLVEFYQLVNQALKTKNTMELPLSTIRRVRVPCKIYKKTTKCVLLQPNTIQYNTIIQ
jgi:hypothetical protein